MIRLEFPRSTRLLASGEFRKVFEQACFRAPHPYFLLLAIRNEQETARAGLVVAKKNVRKAVDRNRIKRLVRESFRHRLGTLPELDIVVLVRKDAGTAENKQLLAVLDKLWSRLQRQAEEQIVKSEAK